VPRARSSLPVEFLPTRRAGRGAAARVRVTAAMREFNRFVLVPARLNAAVSWAPASGVGCSGASLCSPSDKVSSHELAGRVDFELGWGRRSTAWLGRQGHSDAP
jgi:hypothetical protein